MSSSDAIPEIPSDLNGAGLRIGIAVARFNAEIGDGLLSSCTATLAKLGVPRNAMLVASVPGALELPLILLSMARGRHFDALIALGAVVRGDTYHFEIVANESAAGIARVALETGIPVANGVLTTENEDQALARMARKGADCAAAAVEMANALRHLDKR